MENNVKPSSKVSINYLLSLGMKVSATHKHFIVIEGTAAYDIVTRYMKNPKATQVRLDGDVIKLARRNKR